MQQQLCAERGLDAVCSGCDPFHRPKKNEDHLSLGLRDGVEIRTLFRQRTSNQTHFEPKFPEDISQRSTRYSSKSDVLRNESVSAPVRVVTECSV